MLEIGTVLLLEPRNTLKEERYKCRLLEREGNMLYIDYPINLVNDRTAYLLDGTQLKAVFVNKQSAFSFDTEVTGRLKQKIPLMKLYFPGEESIMKIQRRQFVRIKTAVDVAVHPLQGEFAPFTAVTEDISAGGMSILVRKHQNAMLLEETKSIKTVIVLPRQSGDYHYMQLKSKVIRIDKAVQTSFCKVSLSFQEATPLERQQILQFTFERQLEQKKKGIDYLE